jgi:hypothetical protein
MIPLTPSAPLAVATLVDDLEHVFGIGKDPCPPLNYRPWIAWRRDPAGEYHHAGYGWGREEGDAIGSLAGAIVNLLRAQGAVASGVGPVTILDPRLEAEVERIHAQEAEARARRERELAEAAARFREDQERRQRLREEIRPAKGKMKTVTINVAKGKQSVRAWTRQGLAVHRTLYRAGEEPREPRWTATHILTGLAFGHRFPSREAARAFAVRLPELVPGLEGIRTAKEAVRAVRGKEERLRALVEDPFAP